MDAIIRNRLKYTEPDYSQDWQYTTNSTSTLVTKYIGTNTTVLTPNKIKKLPVVLQNSPNSSSGVFTNNRNITSVTFDDGITFTNNSMSNTFSYCTNLTQAPNIPNSVTNMSNTFYYCRNLTQAPNIPNSVTNMSYTFNYCTNLTQIPNIPNSVTNMSYTFYYCNKLTQAPNIPNSVTSMGKTFSYCYNLTQAPNIPNSVTNMSYTFYYCTNLTQIPNIPNSVTNMAYTFMYCNRLTQAPNIPNSVTSMAYTFRNCTNLIGNIIIKSENISNFRYCFYYTNASKVKNVYIPYKYANGVNTKTYNAAFNGSYGISKKNGVTVYDINTYTG